MQFCVIQETRGQIIEQQENNIMGQYDIRDEYAILHHY